MVSHRLFAIFLLKKIQPCFVMANMKRFFLVGVLVLLVAPVSLQAQSLTASEKPSAYRAERQLIEATLQTIVAVIQEATMQNKGSGLGDRLRDITSKLSRATTLIVPTSNAARPREDLDDLRRMLRDINRQLEALHEDLEAEKSYDLANRVRDIEGDLRRALREVDRLSDEEQRGVVKLDDGERWLQTGRHRARRDDERERRHQETDLEIDEEIQREVEEARDDWDRRRDRRHRTSDFDWHSYTGAFVGE